MEYTKVRNGGTYRFQPVPIDFGVGIETGTIVRVGSVPGMPYARTVNAHHVHVYRLGGQHAGFIHVNSLQHLTASEKKSVRKAITAGPHRRPTDNFVIEYGKGVERG